MSSYKSQDNSHSAVQEDDNLSKKIRTIIFGTHTTGGKAFDIVLLVLILLSVLTVMLESVSFIDQEYHQLLRIVEWTITVIFTIEYIVRIVVVNNSIRYVISFYGIVDLLSIIPTYLSLFLVGYTSLSILRAIRLLRIFRILKLVQFMTEAEVLGRAMKASRYKIIVFFAFVLISVILLGSVMYMIEGPSSGFNSIPLSIYWAIVTLTTVGFGDITPQTVLGQIVASGIMLLGYCIIAIPTGFVGAELYRELGRAEKAIPEDQLKKCGNCGLKGHSTDAKYCRKCGSGL